MFKYILVPATGADNDGPVFSTALAVARLAPSHLAFLHVRMDVPRALTAMATADIGGGVGYDGLLESLEQDAAARQKKAEQAFHHFCEREALPLSSDRATDLPSAEWRMEVGDEPAWLAEHGRTADLLVVGRARAGDAAATDVLEACLMATGRPVLIATDSAPNSLPGTVAIAWKDKPEPARAVAAAQPFLEKADQVVIVSVDEGVDETNGAACERLRYALSWHNPHTAVRHLRQDGRPAVDILLEAARDAGADLLVMGGYGHSRLREVIFGGVTRHVLRGADLPILMAH